MASSYSFSTAGASGHAGAVQRVLRLLVKDVLIGPEKITIRHRIPHRQRTSNDANTDTEGEHCQVRWGVVSPVLANLFMHYAFDAWMAREHPGVQFERYADDAVVHCVTEAQAKRLVVAIRLWPALRRNSA